MNKSDQSFHGSDLEKVEKIYGIKKEEIINFSGNVNPLGISPNLLSELSKKIELITKYPDREYTSLKTQISKYVNTDINNIVVGNGSTELISLFIKVVSPKNAVIIGPTYSEYEREIYISGGSAKYYPLSEEKDFKIDVEDLKSHLDSSCDLLVICNPNNPTSTAIKYKELRKILDYCMEENIYVMIDETYVEFVDDIKTVSATPLAEFYYNLFIIRGVSKFFSAPGLRLGYGICGNVDIIREINKKKNPWTINSLAAYAGELLLSDKEYIQTTKALISTERNKIYNTLNSWKNVKVYKPEANFILFKLLDDNITSHQVFEQLIKQKIMVRNASTFPFLSDKYIRFCFLSPEENTLLLEKLEEIIKSRSFNTESNN